MRVVNAKMKSTTVCWEPLKRWITETQLRLNKSCSTRKFTLKDFGSVGSVPLVFTSQVPIPGSSLAQDCQLHLILRSA